MARIEVQERSSSETCPLCRAALGDARVVTCGSCRTVYHAECGAEFGSGCPTAGCSATQPEKRVRRRTISVTPQRESQERGCVYELASLFLTAFGVLGVLISAAYLYVEKRDLGPAKLVLALAVALVVAGWFLNPSRTNQDLCLA